MGMGADMGEEDAPIVQLCASLCLSINLPSSSGCTSVIDDGVESAWLVLNTYTRWEWYDSRKLRCALCGAQQPWTHSRPFHGAVQSEN